MRVTVFSSLFILAACAAGEPSMNAVAPDVDAGPDAEPPRLATDGGGIDANISEYEWVRVPIPIEKTPLFDVWGAAPDDVWAVGASGTILHWNGREWQPSATGYAEAFYSVWGSGAGDVWVGSTTQFMLHGTGWSADGGSWQLTPPLPFDENNPDNRKANIYGIRGTGPNDVWAVGDYTVVIDGTYNQIGAWHWGGNRWNPVLVVFGFVRLGTDGEQDALHSVWLASAQDVWVGGTFGKMYRNPKWDPLVPLERTGGGMDVIPPWEEYDSASRAHFERIWGTGATDIWAVGRNGVLRHWDGTSTFLWTTVDIGVEEDLHSVWGRTKSDFWVIGDDSTIMHWDGARWTRESAEPGLRLYNIWGDDENVWIVGEGVILRRTRTITTGVTQ